MLEGAPREHGCEVCMLSIWAPIAQTILNRLFTISKHKFIVKLMANIGVKMLCVSCSHAEDRNEIVVGAT